jgi:hypothetical protein
MHRALASALMRFFHRSARAAWATSTGRATPGCSEKSAIYAGSLDDAPLQPHRVRVVLTQYRAQYVQTPGERTGHLLYILGSDLVAQRFDASALKLEGDPVKVASGVTLAATNGFADFTTASDGTLVYGSRPVPQTRLIWKPRSGSDGDVVLEPGVYTSSRRSPDGHVFAFGEFMAAKGKVFFVLDFARGTRMQLTFDEIADDPVWSPDGRRIAAGNPEDDERAPAALLVRKHDLVQPTSGRTAPSGRAVSDD